MNLTRVFDSNSDDFKDAYSIYKKSFPIFEQRNFQDQVEALADKDYFFQIVKDNNNTVLGILFTWQTEKFVYAEHLAILESSRGQNIGTTLLTDLKKNSDLPIILEIDPPVDEVSIRRRGFYEKQGYIMNDFNHIHPAFTSESNAYNLKVMSNPRIDESLYKEFYDYLVNRIMHYSFSRKK